MFTRLKPNKMEGYPMKVNRLASTMIFALFAVLVLTLVAHNANALPTVEQVKINGNVFQPGDSLVVQRGDTLTISVKLSSQNASDNVEVDAQILGYEHNDISPIYDRTSLFDMQSGDTEYRTLTLKLPTLMQKDYYDLRVQVGSRTGPTAEYLYQVRLSGSRHNLVVKDVTFNPSDQVLSGRAFLGSVLVHNYGDVTENDVKVALSMPQAGVSATAYIDHVNADQSEQSQDLFLRVPNCLPSGRYNVVATVSYNDGTESDRYNTTVNVVTDQQLCDNVTGAQGQVNMVVAGPQQVAAGKSTVVPVVITNSGSSTQTLVMSVTGASSFSTVSVSPSSVLVVPAGGQTTAYLTFDVNKDAAAGTNVVAVSLADTSGKTIGQAAVPLTVAAAQAQGTSTESVRRWLEISLLVLVVLLILLGIIVALTRMRGNGEEGEGTKAYY
jgi:uncharacterized membrane protein